MENEAEGFKIVKRI